jgi:WD40 repeat protein
MTMQALDAYATQIASFPFICDQRFEDRDTLLSPNGTWLAIHCGYDPPGQTLEVVRQDGTRWVLQFSDYVHPEFIYDELTPMGGLYPQQWTADEKYLFFSSYIGFDGGGTCFYGFGSHGLFRLDLTSGAVSVILPLRGSPSGYLYAFSPGGRRLAYVADPPVILDLRTGELTPFHVGQEFIGNLTWSPDGRELAYAACSSTADYLTVERSMVRIYSLETGLSRTILDLEKTFIRIWPWDGSRQLEIDLFDWQTFDDSYLYYDWASGALITPTPTPTPTQ